MALVKIEKALLRYRGRIAMVTNGRRPDHHAGASVQDEFSTGGKNMIMDWYEGG